LPTDARLPGRATIYRAAADLAHPDGQRTRARHLVHLRRADVAAARRDLRRAGSPRPVRPEQRAGHLRRLQGRRVQPGGLRPRRHHPRQAHHLAERRRRQQRRTVHLRRGHPGPPGGQRPPSAPAARLDRRRSAGSGAAPGYLMYVPFPFQSFPLPCKRMQCGRGHEGDIR